MSVVFQTDKIKSMPLFAGLEEYVKGELLKDARTRNYKKGENIFLQGDEIKHFYIICSGSVQLLRTTSEGRDITTDIITTGKTMCKKEVFKKENRTHQLSAIAISDVTLLEFPALWLKTAALKNPVMALNIITAISEYAHMVELETEHKSNMSAAQQLACFLQRVCILHDFDPRGFELPYSKTIIASRLGMQMETLSRTLPKLGEYGITIDGTNVSIHDISAIEHYVCSHCSAEGNCAPHNNLVDKMKL